MSARRRRLGQIQLSRRGHQDTKLHGTTVPNFCCFIMIYELYFFYSVEKKVLNNPSDIIYKTMLFF
jgi:hypothetical protein